MQTLGLALAALSFGTLAWVFLVQAPWLTKKLGRDRFVPIQMSLMRPLLVVTSLASLGMLAASSGHVRLVAAGVSLALCAVAWGVTPRALRAGGQSLRQKLESDDAHSSARFVADGGGEATKLWHRVLGLTLVAMLGAQGVWLLVPGSAASHDDHHAQRAETPHAHPNAPARGPRHHATEETVETVQALRTAVDRALAAPTVPGDVVSATLKPLYATIFERCTMQGEAHEALHAYLVPVGPQLEALASTTDEAASRAALARLKAHLDTWPERFE